MGHLTLVTGGVRSGKSMFAEQLASKHKQVAYIATCQCFDEEMKERITVHQSRRPGHWELIEEPLSLSAAMERAQAGSFIIVECLGLWLTNFLLKNEELPEQDFLRLLDKDLQEFLLKLDERKHSAVIVTNEVGMGIVPPYKLGRTFRDCLGVVNQAIARKADDVYLCAAGMPLCLKKAGVLIHE